MFTHATYWIGVVYLCCFYAGGHIVCTSLLFLFLGVSFDGVSLFLDPVTRLEFFYLYFTK